MAEQNPSKTPKRPSKGRRILIYLLLSACATGVVIGGFTDCRTYSGERASFLECFLLYAIPIPMALGVLKIPTQLVGAITCAFFTPARARLWAWTLGFMFCAGLLLHIAASMAGYRDNWILFAFVTVDFGILAAIAYSMRSPPDS